MDPYSEPFTLDEHNDETPYGFAISDWVSLEPLEVDSTRGFSGDSIDGGSLAKANILDEDDSRAPTNDIQEIMVRLDNRTWSEEEIRQQDPQEPERSPVEVLKSLETGIHYDHPQSPTSLSRQTLSQPNSEPQNTPSGSRGEAQTALQSIKDRLEVGSGDSDLGATSSTSESAGFTTTLPQGSSVAGRLPSTDDDNGGLETENTDFAGSFVPDPFIEGEFEKHVDATMALILEVQNGLPPEIFWRAMGKITHGIEKGLMSERTTHLIWAVVSAAQPICTVTDDISPSREPQRLSELERLALFSALTSAGDEGLREVVEALPADHVDTELVKVIRHVSTFDPVITEFLSVLSAVARLEDISLDGKIICTKYLEHSEALRKPDYDYGTNFATTIPLVHPVTGTEEDIVLHSIDSTTPRTSFVTFYRNEGCVKVVTRLLMKMHQETLLDICRQHNPSENFGIWINIRILAIGPATLALRILHHGDFISNISCIQLISEMDRSRLLFDILLAQYRNGLEQLTNDSHERQQVMIVAGRIQEGVYKEWRAGHERKALWTPDLAAIRWELLLPHFHDCLVKQSMPEQPCTMLSILDALRAPHTSGTPHLPSSSTIRLSTQHSRFRLSAGNPGAGSGPPTSSQGGPIRSSTVSGKERRSSPIASRSSPVPRKRQSKGMLTLEDGQKLFCVFVELPEQDEGTVQQPLTLLPEDETE